MLCKKGCRDESSNVGLFADIYAYTEQGVLLSWKKAEQIAASPPDYSGDVNHPFSRGMGTALTNHSKEVFPPNDLRVLCSARRHRELPCDSLSEGLRRAASNAPCRT